jgi:hypothetical protein
MAKAKAKQARQQPQPAPRRAARQTDAERLNRLLIVGGVVAAILIAIGFIAFGWYQTKIRPLGKTVLSVADTEFSLGHLERRMRLERKESPFYDDPQALILLPNAVYDQLEKEGKLIEGAKLLDISVTEEELAARFAELGALPATTTPSAYASAYREQVASSGLHEGEYRQMITAQLLEEKVRNYFRFLAPGSEAQVHARWLVFQDEESAEGVLERLQAGEDFAEIAPEVSLDGNTAEKGGDLGWLVRGGNALMPKDVEDFLFEQAEPGERSGAVAAGSYFFISELLERADDRALDDVQREQVGSRGFEEWLDGLDASLSVERDFTADDANKALSDII